MCPSLVIVSSGGRHTYALPDKVEAVNDPDRDATPNCVDRDSDGDSILDVVEGSQDSDGDSTLENARDPQGVPSQPPKERVPRMRGL